MQESILDSAEKEVATTFGSSRRQRLKNFLNDEIIPSDLLEFELILIAFACGINDAATYTDYHIFIANQTGNTVFLGVRALGLAEDTIDLRNVCVSISVFLIGGFVFGRAGLYLGPTRRSWLFATNTIQSTFIFVAAALRHWYAPGATFSARHDPRRFCISALMAFASGGQIAMARSTKIPAITTAIVTSAYIDVLIDPKLFARRNRSRDRIIIFCLALMSGSFVGAAAYRYVAPAFAILLAATVKASVVVLLFFNPAKKRQVT